MPGRLFKLYGAVALALCVSGCDTRPGAQPAAAAVRTELPPRLRAAPFDELAFVPHDVASLARLDLVALAERGPEAQEMLEFMLEAQQPELAMLLERAGIRAGKELHTIYLAVDGSAEGDAVLVGVGEYDLPRVEKTLRGFGGKRDVASEDGLALYRWTRPRLQVGGHEQPGGTRRGALAVAAMADMIVVGEPELVARCVHTRRTGGLDVRWSVLKEQLLGLDPGAAVWAVARPVSGDALTRWAPGLNAARGQAWAEPDGRITMSLLFGFEGGDKARAFRDKLATLLWLAEGVALDPAIRARVAGLRQAADIRVESDEVVVNARF